MKTKNTSASYNAICQAVKVLVPRITRETHREVCGYPDCQTATNRYWRETYNIRPWESRSTAEQALALTDARNWISTAASQGVRCAKIRHLIEDGEIAKPNRCELAIAGYHYHHTASRRGYCPVALVGTVERYNGNFGHGLIRRLGRGGPFGNSTNYESISYFTKE